MIQINCYGQFSVIDTDTDKDITPRSRKAKALLALLALASSEGRTRHYVQRTLWSDRGREQGSASLRGVLSEIRKAFGKKQSVLIAKGDRLVLDTVEVQVRFDKNVAVGRELLEGFEVVRDPMFVKWLECERNRGREVFSSSQVSPGRHEHLRPTVILDYKFNGNELHTSVLGTVVNRITVALLESDVLGVIDTNDITALTDQMRPSSFLQVKLRIAESGSMMFFFITAHDISSGCVIHSDQVTLDPQGEWYETCLVVEQLCSCLVDVIVNTTASRFNVGRGYQIIPAALSRRAIGCVFDLDKNQMAKADKLFKQSYALNPNGNVLAWRAFLRSLSKFQHLNDSFLEDDISIEILSMKALRNSSRDSTVLSIASQFEYLHKSNSQASLRLAINAVEINPLNALSWAVLSNTQLSMGRFDEAHRSANRARVLSIATPQQYYFEFFCCMSASASGKIDEAIKHAELSLVLKPDFVAPRRYLVALYRKNSMGAEYDANLLSLKEIEPEFCVERLGDADYPVNTLRRISLIDVVL